MIIWDVASRYKILMPDILYNPPNIFCFCFRLVTMFSPAQIQDGDSIISAVSELAVMSATKPVFSDDLKSISDLIEEAFLKSINSMENFLDMWHRYHVLRELLMVSHFIIRIFREYPSYKLCI